MSSEANAGTPNAAPQETQQSPSVNPTFQQPPVGSPDRPAPQLVTVALDQLQRYVGLERELNDFRTAQQAAMEAEQQKAIRAMAEKGQIEQALEQQKQIWAQKEQETSSRLAAFQQRYNAEKVNATLAQSLGGITFAGDDEAARGEAARMFAANIKDSLEVIENSDGSTSVVEKVSRRPAADLIRERLSDPKLAFFLAASARGGAGTDGGRPPATQTNQPPSLLDEMVAQRNATPTLFAGVGLKPKFN